MRRGWILIGCMVPSIRCVRSMLHHNVRSGCCLRRSKRGVWVEITIERAYIHRSATQWISDTHVCAAHVANEISEIPKDTCTSRWAGKWVYRRGRPKASFTLESTTVCMASLCKRSSQEQPHCQRCSLPKPLPL